MSDRDYEIIKKIGSGTFGDVFSGKDKITGQYLAIKRVKKSILYQYGDYLINAFWKELDSMRKCNCENSVKLIKYFETKNNYNIVMELCDSDLLNLSNNRNPFSVDEVRETFIQLNNVFKIMHKNNIVHRDLKLGNVLIKFIDNSKQKFIPKLSDYGFSKDLNNNNYTATHLGTPATMAPEIMMNQPYNDKSDLWSIGVMMYQLHYKEIPYPGFNEKAILDKICRNCTRKHPNDQQFRDLLNRLLVMNPNQRISWNDYFNHPFFQGNAPQKKEIRYTKISDFNLGFNVDKNMFECFIAKDNSKNKNVLIKSYSNELINNNNQLFSDELALFQSFKGNQSVLKIIDLYKENNRTNLVFEYIECQSLFNYAKNKEITEKEIKKFNKTLYDNIFIFNECNFLPFIFISIHSFCIDIKGNPLVFDFGFHKLFISSEEFNSYFLSNLSEVNNFTKNRIKTNVMNYGIVLLKLFCGNTLEIKGKEIILPQNKILSDAFSGFISKCLRRNINNRSSWLELGDDSFILDDNIQISNIIGNSVLLDNDKLELIFESLKNKFDFIIKYYEKLDIKQNLDYIQQIESFVIVTLFEMKIINNFFDRNIYKKPFTNQQEISFISINDDSEIKTFSLNLLNPLLRDTKIIDMNNNKLIKDFVSYIKKKISALEKISSKIHRNSKKSIINGSFAQFLKNLILNFDNSKIQEYFFSVNRKAEEAKSNSDAYKELCLAEYLCEFILFIKTILYDKDEQIHFDKKSFIKKFYDVFGEDKNKIEISVINIKETKKNYVIVSFLAILFKCYKDTDAIDKVMLDKNKQTINGLVRYYPTLMKKIVDMKNKKK